MTLRRSGCYGDCAVYSVELRGDGEVRFNGARFVLMTGEQRARVDPRIVGCLLDDFRTVDFWSLRPRYAAPAFDLPTYEVTLKIGGQTRTVIDYAGRMVGMPAGVTALEDALDSAAGAGRWISGDTGLVDWLSADGFDFRSAAAVRLAIAGVRTASDDTLLGLVERGAPLDTPSDASQPDSRRAGAELLWGAIVNGKTALFRKLVQLGWLPALGLPIANDAFAESSAGCEPALVDAAAAAGLNMNAATPGSPPIDANGPELGAIYGETALAGLATDYACRDEAARVATADRLLANGADPNLRNSKGETSIFDVENLDLLNLLLSHGADPTLRAKDGNSAVFGSWTDAIVLRLLEAGASPEGRYFDGKTLREQAEEHSMHAVEQWLDAHQGSSPSH